MSGVPPRLATAGKTLLVKSEDVPLLKQWAVVDDRVDPVLGEAVMDSSSDDGDRRGQQEWLKHRLHLRRPDIW